MILLEDVLRLHSLSLQYYGGKDGIREMDMLQSAIGRPFQTFGGEELYPTLFEKASALLESLVKNHPFIDGNKRTGFLVYMTFLRENNYWIHVEKEIMYEFIIGVAEGRNGYQEILSWTQLHAAVLFK